MATLRITLTLSADDYGDDRDLDLQDEVGRMTADAAQQHANVHSVRVQTMWVDETQPAQT